MSALKTSFAIPFVLSSLLAAAVCFAQPVHLETEAAHIIVTRPIDTWAGNRTTAEYTLAGLKEKKVAFYYYDAAGNKILGSGGLFKQPPQTPVVVGVQGGLTSKGFTNNGPSGMVFTVEKAVMIAPEKMPDFGKLQNELYNEYVVSQGDPATLADRIMAKKFVNVGITLALFNVGMDRLGAVSGSQFVFSTGIADDIAKLTLHDRMALAAVPSPEFDYAQFKAVEVRKVTFGSDRVGQIIIAYKNDKTPEAADAALAMAIVTASGADTTPDQVVAARQQDFDNRVRVWGLCQSRGACAKN